MQTFINSNKVFWLVLGGIALLVGALVLLAPAERTLGDSIKIVYLHVALIWGGMTGLSFAGVMGLVVAISPHKRLQEWAQTTGLVSLVSFGGGIGISMIAAKVNWGSISWAEPRMFASLNVLALAIIVQVINGWPIWERLKGILRVLLTIFLSWSILNTPLILHPRDPIRESSSVAIQISFIGLFILCFLIGAWIVFYLRRDKRPA